MKKTISNILFFIIFFVSNNLFGTNLQINNVTYSNTDNTVSFDISWENSWRLGANTTDLHDAVWIFVKFNSCDTTNYQGYTHGLLSTVMSDHLIESSLVANPIDVAPDNTGVMLRRTNVGEGNILPKRITLSLLNMPTDIAEIKVFGTEMTYIQTGAFYVGDGLRNRWILREGGNNGNTYADPFLINSENDIPVGDQVGRLWCTPQIPFWGQVFTVEQGFFSTTTTIPTTFPKGYENFYAMKTEITQQQYADFLNTINHVDFIEHYRGTAPSTPGTMVHLYGPSYLTDYHNIYSLVGDWRQVYAVRPHQAMALISWSDLQSFLSWAALRPLTDLEYEKMCRGPEIPTPFQAAWGDAIYSFPGQRINVGTPQETVENAGLHGVSNVIGNGQAAAAYVNYTMRVGYQGYTGLATTRQSLAAGYYGNLGLADNLNEYYVSLRDANMTYQGTWGKGNVQYPSDWQGIVGEFRNGGWGLGQNWELSISARNFRNLAFQSGAVNGGGRGGR